MLWISPFTNVTKLSIKGIRKFVKQTLCFLFNFYCGTHTHTCFLITDESWEGRNTCMWIYTFWIYSLSTLENTDENKIFFCSFTTPQAFWQSSAPGALSTLVTSVVLLVNPSHTDESWEGRNTCMWIIIILYV